MLDFLKELTRRKVWLFGGLYLALAWLLLQVAIAVESTLSLPEWVDQIALVLLGLGFPVALLLAWAQESATKTEAAIDTKKSDKRPSFSIAVLPFDNLSDDSTLDSLADGLAEDVITLLNGYLGLHVTARNTSFQFKGQAIDIRGTGDALDVRYVLEGSLRLIGDDLRVTAQLINTETGDHLWADRYDLPSTMIEKEQDAVIDKISANVGDVIMLQEVQRLRCEPAETLTGDEIANVADYLFWKASKKHLGDAVNLLESAVEKQPGSAMAHAYLAFLTSQLPAFGLGEPQVCRNKTLKEASLAIELAPSDPTVLACIAAGYMFLKNNIKALTIAEQAVELGPKNPRTYYVRADVRTRKGEFEAGLEDLETAAGLISVGSPLYFAVLLKKSIVLFQLGRLEEAEVLATESLLRQRSSMGFTISISCLGHLGRANEAADLIQQYKKWWPEAALETIEESERAHQTSEKYLQSLVSGLQLAGLE